MATMTITGGTQLVPLTPADFPLGIYANTAGNYWTSGEASMIVEIGDGITPTWFDDSGWTMELQPGGRVYLKAGATWISGKQQNGISVNGGNWLMNYNTRFFIDTGLTTKALWYGQTISWVGGDSSGSYFGIPATMDPTSYLDLKVQAIRNAIDMYLAITVTGIQYVKLDLRNTKLQIDSSSAQIDELRVNGLTNIDETSTHVFGNTYALTLNNYSPLGNVAKIETIYGGYLNTAKKDFYLNNPVINADNILFGGQNFDIHINNDVSLIINDELGALIPDIDLTFIYRAGSLPDVIPTTNSFRMLDIWRGFRSTELNAVIAPDIVYDNRTVTFFITKFGYVKKVLTETVALEGPMLRTIFLTPFNDATLTEAASLAVTGVNISFFLDYSENGLLWNYTLDCGGNSLSDVHDYMYAIQLSSATYFGKIGVDWWQILVKDGAFHKAVWDGNGNGVRVVNYGGKLTTMQSNTGELFAPFVYSNLNFTGLVAGTKLKIYDSNTNLEIGGTDKTGTSYTYQYSWSGINVAAYVVIFHVDYIPLKFDVSLIEGDSTSPVTQTSDRVYYNPPAPYLATNLFVTGKNNPVTLTLADVVADSTYDGNPFNTAEITGITINNPVTKGTFLDNGNSTFTFTPTLDYLGGDSLDYSPIYNKTYEGVTTDGSINFDVALFNGLGFENIIILGDSIFARVFDNGLTQQVFIDKHLELYNKPINVFGEAVSGRNAAGVLDTATLIMDKYSYLDPLKTMVLVGVGTNDIYTTRLDGELLNLDNRQGIQANLLATRDIVESYGFTYVQGEIPFLVFDTGTAADTVYEIATNTITNEILGSTEWNFSTDGIVDTAVLTSPLFTVTDGVTTHTIEQAYEYAKQWRAQGFEDSVHPNYFGRVMYQQAILDTLMLYNAYGKKPFAIGNTFNHQAIINISDATVVGPDLHGRISNTYDYTVGGVMPINYNDGLPTPWSIDITTNGSLVNTGVDLTLGDAQYLPNELLTMAIEVLAGTTITITLSGLIINEIYKFQAIGSFPSLTAYVGTMNDPVLNRTTTCSSADAFATTGNKNDYYDFTLIPQATTQTLTLTTDGASPQAYISAIMMWHLASGN